MAWVTWPSEETRVWIQKAYNTKDRLPLKYQHILEIWHAFYISKNVRDMNRYCNLLEESGLESRLIWYDLATFYLSLDQSEKSVEVFERIEDISLERGSDWKYEPYYHWYGRALHKVGKHEKEKELYEIGLRIRPKSGWITLNQAVCALSLDDTTKANECLEKAEVHFRKAYELEPQDLSHILILAGFLIEHDINIYERMELIPKGFETELDNPFYSFYLQVKGWGSYKQGEYEEAIQLLRRAEDVGMYDYELDQ
jgi:tetratricopeptide (TPR) repeat protein